jgi:hypothetical protein
MKTGSNEWISATELARVVANAEAPLSVDVERLHARMSTVLATHICGVTGDRDRDVESIWDERDETCLVYGGFAGKVLRLLCSIVVDPDIRSATVTLRAAKGSVGVDQIEWGVTGPEVGNSILVARLLHIGIMGLRAEGIVVLLNDPWDERLRTLYQLMGFERGERLALDDEGSLTRAFGYVERSYQRFGLRLTTL